MRSGFANSFQKLTQFVFLLGFGLVVVASSPAFAQDTLEQLQAEWKELDVKMSDAEASLEGDDADTDKIQKQYNALITEANVLIKEIEAAAKAKIKAEPGDSNATRALMGILLNDAENGKEKKVLESGQELIASGINAQYFKIAAKSERISIAAREIFDELIIRQEEALKNDLPRVKFETTKGDIVMELFENEAPETVGNFISLVESGYYSDILFHRVMDGFMAQTGGYIYDAEGIEKKKDGPDYTIECECYRADTRQHYSHSLSMAHTGTKDTGSAQFFMTFQRSTTAHLDGLHTCFGRVIEGTKTLELVTRTHDVNNQEFVDDKGKKIDIKRDKIISATVLRKRDHRYRPNKVGIDEAALDAAEAKRIAEEKAEEEAKAAAIAKAAEEKRMAEEAATKEAAAKKAAEEKRMADEAAAKKKAEEEAKKKDAEEAAEEAEKKKAEAAKAEAAKAEAEKKKTAKEETKGEEKKEGDK